MMIVKKTDKGSPGKIVRQVTDEEIKHIRENASHYVAKL